MDKARITEILKQLTALDGPTGAETKVAGLVRTLAGETVAETRIDALGNLIARRPASTQPPRGRIMLAAHMDEIGLVVTKVDQGFLHVARVGGVDPRSLLGQEVTVYPSGPGCEAYPNGLPGYIGGRPPHLLSEEERKKVIPMGDLRVDLGMPASFFANGAAGGVVRVGDRIVWRGPATELMDGRLATKALDDRACVAVMLGALGYLAGSQHTWDVLAVATVQEEYGMRGATTAAFGVAPDLAIALDVTFANTPGVSEDETYPMDHGPTIGVGPNLHPGVVKRLKQVAGDLEIPFSVEPMAGPTGTDAWAIQVTQEGVPTGLLSVPVRYMHSSVETVAVVDIDRTARLLAAFIARLDGDTLAGLAEDLW